MICNERQELIIDTLENQQFVSAQYIAQLTGCSVATIRRDFSKLAEDNQLVQIRGGAQAMTKPAIETQEHDSDQFLGSLDAQGCIDDKQSIVKRAVELCNDGESIFIGDGDYTYRMADYMANLNLNILTNSLRLALEVIRFNRVQCSLLGGVIDRQKAIIPGINDEALIPYYPCGKIFINAFESANAASSLYSLNAGILQKLRDQADQLIVLCESSKLNINTDSITNSLAEGDVLITDHAVIPSLPPALRNLGITCIIADAHKHQ